jgi:hypothetical protein
MNSFPKEYHDIPQPHGAVPLTFVTSNLSVEADIPRYELLCDALETDKVYDTTLCVWGSNSSFTEQAQYLADTIADQIDKDAFMPRVLGGFSGGADVLFDVMELLKQRGEKYLRAIAGLILLEPSPYRDKSLDILKAHQSLWETDYQHNLSPEGRASLENRRIPHLTTPIMIFLGQKSMALLHFQAGAIAATMPETTTVHIVPEAEHYEIVSNPDLHGSVAEHARKILTMQLGSVAVHNYEGAELVHPAQDNAPGSWKQVGQSNGQVCWDKGLILVRNNQQPDTMLRLNPKQWACFVHFLHNRDLLPHETV